MNLFTTSTAYVSVDIQKGNKYKKSAKMRIFVFISEKFGLSVLKAPPTYFITFSVASLYVSMGITLSTSPAAMDAKSSRS